MESILLSNIAAIIVKDILIDDNKTKCKTPKFTNNFPLLSADTDHEAYEFFLHQREQKRRKNEDKIKINEKIRTPNSSENNVKKLKTEVDNSIQTVIAPYDVSGRQTPLEVNLLNKFHATEFEGYLHMSKMTFLRIFQSLRQYLPNEHFATTAPPQTIFSLALWKLTTDEHFEDIGRKFNVTKYVCQQVIRLFWRRISAQYETLIQWPSTPQKRNCTMQSFQAYKSLTKFHHLFGVVAIKQLEVFLEAENEERQVILQIVCDGDQKIMDCFLALTSDYKFDASPIGQTLALNLETMPLESYLIGDKSFPLRTYLIRPIESPNGSREHAFNKALESALLVGRQVLETVAKRFNALYALEARNLHEVRKIVDTICALHNKCVELEDDYAERKQMDIPFNWASMTNGGISKQGDDQNEQGRRKRAALTKEILGY